MNFILKFAFVSLIFLFASLFVGAQDLAFNGDYTSHKTSYNDLNNKDNSFVEEATNNVFIQIEEVSGVFVFQDKRLPKNILSYKIDSFKGKMNDGKKEIYTYNCTSLNNAQAKSEQIILYVNKDGVLDIIISDASSYQVFFNLKKQ